MSRAVDGQNTDFKDEKRGMWWAEQDAEKMPVAFANAHKLPARRGRARDWH